MDYGKLKKELIRDEGLRNHAYRDSVGLYTIGVGHLLGSTPRILDLTDDEVDALLDRDIAHAEDVVHTIFPVTVYGAWTASEDVRMRALVNMAFNRGQKHMEESTTITPAIKAALAADIDHDIAWKKVSNAIKASPWATQIGERAVRLAFMLETGKDPQ